MLYIIYGSDPLGRREAFEKLRAELDKDGSLATNTVSLEARNATPQAVMAACNTVPFLGDSRLVVVEGVLRSVSRLKKSAKRGGRVTLARDEDESEPEGENDTDVGRWLALVDYIPQMPPTTTLALLDDDAPATNVLLKALGPLGRVERCQPPAERELSGWVMARAKKIGLKLDAPAAKLLADLVGQDAYMLASELDKLLAYSGGAVVREADVRELVSRAKEHKGWELADAVIAGQGAKAARVLQEMLEDGQHPQLILATIAGRYRRLAIVKDMLERGESSAAMKSRLGIAKDFALVRLIEQAERMPVSAVRSAYQRLIEADLDVKRGLMDDERLALELAVQELASRPLAGSRR